MAAHSIQAPSPGGLEHDSAKFIPLFSIPQMDIRGGTAGGGGGGGGGGPRDPIMCAYPGVPSYGSGGGSPITASLCGSEMKYP